uniref:Cytochrome P450 n=1 Tax=Nannospalax galili TaxID=1026970 RepID=A0A8C6R634_NANGA
MGLLTGDGLWPLVVFTAIFLLLVDLMHRRQRWTARYPPGPVSLPLLGNMLQMDFKNIPDSMYKLQLRYGSMFSLQMSQKPVVVINGLNAVQEVLVNCGEDTKQRTTWPVLGHTECLSAGVVFAHYGPEWREQRRFSEWVTEEAGCLSAAFADHKGRPFNPYTLLNKATCNVISLIFARRFEYEDPYFIKMLKVMNESLKVVAGFIPEVLNAFPILLRIPSLTDKVFREQKVVMDMIDEVVSEHKMTQDPAQPPRDLTDAFLVEMEKAKGKPESSFTDENLCIVVGELFGAGILTTSTTLTWALLLMIPYPQTHNVRRVQQETDEVIGQARRPEMADQEQMPFTNTVIHKVHIEVHRFLIPKGTRLIANLSLVMKDERAWEKPRCFHPEHFLDSQGGFVKPEAFVPFSAAACLGELLAHMELFLFFTCLLQRFSFSVPAGQPRPSGHRVSGTLTAPSPYQLCAVVRPSEL